MSCSICLKLGKVIKSWHNVHYGKNITSEQLCCPDCKAPGRAEFMPIFKNDNEIQNTLRFLDDNKDWICILCPSCRKLKKYAQKSDSMNICNTFRLVCHDCSPDAPKQCPGCDMTFKNNNKSVRNNNNVFKFIEKTFFAPEDYNDILMVLDYEQRKLYEIKNEE